MANSQSKFFTKKDHDFLKVNADDFSVYEKILNAGLEKSSELEMMIKGGIAITETSKAVWQDLFGDKPYQLTVFSKDDILAISKELFSSEFEEVTSTKCRALRKITDIKKSEKWKGLSEQLKGLKSGAWKEPVFQAILRAVTAISNKNGGNKPTSSLIETLAQALCTVSKKGISENLKENQELLNLIKAELLDFEKAISTGSEFINNHKKKK